MYVIQDVAIYGKKIDPINIVFGLLEFLFNPFTSIFHVDSINIKSYK